MDVDRWSPELVWIYRQPVDMRKAYLFADTQQGAKASAMHYNILETAKASGRNPHEYLSVLFSELPNANSIEEYERLLPVEYFNGTNSQCVQNISRAIADSLMQYISGDGLDRSLTNIWYLEALQEPDNCDKLALRHPPSDYASLIYRTTAMEHLLTFYFSQTKSNRRMPC